MICQPVVMDASGFQTEHNVNTVTRCTNQTTVFSPGLARIGEPQSEFEGSFTHLQNQHHHHLLGFQPLLSGTPYNHSLGQKPIKENSTEAGERLHPQAGFSCFLPMFSSACGLDGDLLTSGGRASKSLQKDRFSLRNVRRSINTGKEGEAGFFAFCPHF